MDFDVLNHSELLFFFFFFLRSPLHGVISELFHSKVTVFQLSFFFFFNHKAREESRKQLSCSASLHCAYSSQDISWDQDAVVRDLTNVVLCQLFTVHTFSFTSCSLGIWAVIRCTHWEKEGWKTRLGIWAHGVLNDRDLQMDVVLFLHLALLTSSGQPLNYGGERLFPLKICINQTCMDVEAPPDNSTEKLNPK